MMQRRSLAGLMLLLNPCTSARARARQAEREAESLVERREEERRPVFQEAVLTLDEYFKIRAVITDISAGGARVQYATRTDLPFRLRISAQTLKLKCWARVVWQTDGAAGLAFLDPD